MKTIAITGSKGKTTIVHILKNILRSLSFNVMTFGTEGTWFDENKLANDSHFISTTIKFKEYHPNFVLVEAISSALRYKSIPCDIAIFTNIEEHEHGESHKTFQDYYNAKKRLFDECTGVVISNDTEIVKDSKATKLVYDAEMLELNSEYMTFKLNGEEYKTKLLGEFNMHNMCLAIMALRECEIYVKDVSEITNAPGRFERFKVGTNTVILDYAHTCNSLEQTLKLIRKIYDIPVVVVFGCGGDRDKTKRPLMGKIALKYAHKVYITTDNPRCEDPQKIIDDIVENNKLFHIILDRESAIRTAIKENPGTIILIAGRGNEEVTEVMGKTLSMSDRNFIK